MVDSALAHCGSSCDACPAIAHGTATCDGRQCGADCESGYYPCGVECIADGMESSCDPCPHLADVASPRIRYGPTEPGSWPANTVLPIFFVARDWPTSSAAVHAEAAAIYSAMIRVQAFYRRELGGVTFTLNDLAVVQARGAKEAYGIRFNGRNIYEDGIDIAASLEGLVVEELFDRGYPTPPGQNADGHTVIIFVKGAGGWAGGRSFSGHQGGWAILGDWSIDSLEGDLCPSEYWFAGQRRQIGAAAHELGHAFTLPHPDAYGGSHDGTIMGAWWSYPAIGFNATDLARLRGNRGAFFR